MFRYLWSRILKLTSEGANFLLKSQATNLCINKNSNNDNNDVINNTVQRYFSKNSNYKS